MNKEMIRAIEQVAKERGVPKEELFARLEDALFAAYMRIEPTDYPARIEIDQKTGTTMIAEYLGDEDFADFDDAPASQVLRTPIDLSEGELGRAAANTVKQVLTQYVNATVSEGVSHDYRARIGEAVWGRVEYSDWKRTLVQLSDALGVVPDRFRMEGERLRKGDRHAFTIIDVNTRGGEVEVILSRNDPKLLEQVLKDIVPEISSGLISVWGIAREPGVRNLIVLKSNGDVDPMSAVRGVGNSRLRHIRQELGREMVNFIIWREDPLELVRRSFGRVRLRSIEEVGPDHYVVGVGRDQEEDALSLLPLVQELLGATVEIAAQDTNGHDHVTRPVLDDSHKGQCTYITKTGKRCPNAALPGSERCALHPLNSEQG